MSDETEQPPNVEAVARYGADYYLRLRQLILEVMPTASPAKAVGMMAATTLVTSALARAHRTCGGVPPQSPEEVQALLTLVTDELRRRRVAA